MNEKYTIKTFIIFISIFLILILHNSCKKKSFFEWKENADIDDFAGLDIEKIIICYPDDENEKIKDWPVMLEISDSEKIKKVVDVIRKSVKYDCMFAFDKMKIITKHKKFIMNIDIDYDGENILGDHFLSRELFTLLKEYGLREPNNYYNRPFPDYKVITHLLGEPNKILICTNDANSLQEWTCLRQIIEPEKIDKIIDILKKTKYFWMKKSQNKSKILTKDKKTLMDFNDNNIEVLIDFYDSQDFFQLLRENDSQIPDKINIIVFFAKQPRVIFIYDPSKAMEEKKRLNERMQKYEEYLQKSKGNGTKQ